MANEVTRSYGVEIMSINIISALPNDQALTKSLASGAVASAEALQAETAARGQANAKKIEAEADAEQARINAKAAADAISSKGGTDAMSQRIAEQYVTNLGEMAAKSNMIIVPDKPNDLAGVVATALSVGDNVKARVGHHSG